MSAYMNGYIWGRTVGTGGGGSSGGSGGGGGGGAGMMVILILGGLFGAFSSDDGKKSAPQNSAQGRWVAENGVARFRADPVSPPAAVPQPPAYAQRYIAAGKILKLRICSQTTCAVVVTLTAGDRFRPVAAAGNGWFRIETEDHYTGYGHLGNI